MSIQLILLSSVIRQFNVVKDDVLPMESKTELVLLVFIIGIVMTYVEILKGDE